MTKPSGLSCSLVIFPLTNQKKPFEFFPYSLPSSVAHSDSFIWRGCPFFCCLVFEYAPLIFRDSVFLFPGWPFSLKDRSRFCFCWGLFRRSVSRRRRWGEFFWLESRLFLWPRRPFRASRGGNLLPGQS